MKDINPYRHSPLGRSHQLRKITDPANEIILDRTKEKPKVFRIIDGTTYNWLRYQYVPIRNGELRIQDFSLEGYKRIGFIEYGSALVLGKKIVTPPHYSRPEFFFMGDADHFVYARMAHFDKKTGNANMEMGDIELFVGRRGKALNVYFKSDDLEEKVRGVRDPD
ncbi:MAG: hypothetical protein ABII01_01685 [Candidatus Woesearchaeota archaeon]